MMLLTVVLEMRALAESSASGELDMYEMFYNETAFQNLMAFVDALSNVTEYNTLKPLLGTGQGAGGNLILTTDQVEGGITEVHLPSTEVQYLFGGQYPSVGMQGAAVDSLPVLDGAIEMLDGNLANIQDAWSLFDCSP